MKRKLILFLSILLIIAGCAPSYESEEKIVQEDTEEEETETAIIPKYNVSEDEYRVVLQYKSGESRGVVGEYIYEPGEARGVIVNQVFSRFDINEMEEGLRRHSKSVFDPDEYYFQEGQYLKEDVVYRWLGSKNTEEEWQEYVNDYKGNPPLSREEFFSGLNPTFKGDPSDPEAYRKNPRYLSHILEQNYLQKTEGNNVDIKGVSIGLALKSVYQFRTEIDGKPGPTYYHEIPEDEMIAKGKEYAQIILERMRKIEKLQDVPIMIALFREEDQASLVSGNYVAKTLVPGSDMTIGEWTAIDEDYILFPSSEAEETYPAESNLMADFTDKVREFFPDYVGVIGKGFYVNDELRELKINVPIEFKGATEVVGFTQYAYGLMMEIFSNQYDVEINVKSTEKQEALLYRKAGEEEPNVYIYQ